MKKIRNKFLVPILSLQLVALALLGFVGYRFSSNLLRKHAESQFRKTITETFSSIDKELKTRVRKVRRLMNSPVFIKFSAAQYYKSDVDVEVFNFQKGNGLILGEPEIGGLVNFPIGLLPNEGGKRVVSMGLFPSEEYVGIDGFVKQHVYLGGSNDVDFEREDKSKLNRENEVWFKSAITGNIFVGKPSTFKLYLKKYNPVKIETQEVAIERKLIPIAIPHIIGNKINGVLMVTTTPNFIHNAMPKSIKNRLLLLLDKDGSVITKRGFLREGNKISLTELVQLPSSNDSSIIDYKNFLIMYKHLPVSNWTIVIIGSKREVLQSVFRLRYRIFTIMLLSLVIMGAAIYFIIKRLINPIIKLKNASERIAKGELGVTIEKETDDEIGQLTDAFNKMSITTKNMHNQLEKNNIKLAKLNYIRKQMLNIISHELRTPLSTVIGFYDLLTEQIQNNEHTSNFKEFKECFDMLGDSIEKCEKLVERLTRVNAIITREISTEEEKIIPSNPAEIIPIVISTFKDAATERGIKISYKATNCLVMCPLEALKIILEEALSNAVKYTDDNTEISITCNATANQTKITVTDQGSGIPKEYIEDVVEPFFEVQDSIYHFTDRIKKGGGGLGLGFTIMLNLLKHYNGDLKISSEKGKGTTIEIILPTFKT